jgi:2-octaprenyl-6-methoxyphenol hydroxylase
MPAKAGMKLDSSILIIGGGPVGATLALALQAKNIPLTILEAREKAASHQDQRALALSYGSRLILERLGVWPELDAHATAIGAIHISQRGSFGRALLKAEDEGQPALGYVLPYGALSAALDRALDKFPQVQIINNAEATFIEPGLDHESQATVTFKQAGTEKTMHSQLAILADGGRSLGDIRGLHRETKDYGHDALVTKVQCELPHDNVAYERFTPAGPIALLPNGERDFSLVWTGKSEAIGDFLELEDEAFLVSLHRHFGDRVGRFLKVGKRMRFPLRLAYLDPVTAPHLVVIGNAAQTMHPVAGQGFNVGLRDAWTLADMIGETPSPEWGEEAMLHRYQQARRTDTRGGIFFTDFLVKVFSNEIAGLSGLRASGLGLLDIVSPIKKRLVGKMSFGPTG